MSEPQPTSCPSVAERQATRQRSVARRQRAGATVSRSAADIISESDGRAGGAATGSSAPPTKLIRIAQQAVLALENRRRPARLPESDPGWNDAFVSAVLERKQPFRDSKDLQSLLRLVSERHYGQSVHWALELIQNAEDEGARRIANS